MYYPYLRGKQFELILLREQAHDFAHQKIHPIIEPVKKDLSSIEKTLKTLNKQKASYVLLINPENGELKHNTKPIFELIEQLDFNDNKGISLGYIIRSEKDLNALKTALKKYQDFQFSLVYWGQVDIKDIKTTIKENKNIKEHIFIERHTGNAYTKQFVDSGLPCILIRDGFIQRKNDTYPTTEHFSDIHLTYNTEGFVGFGDFLTIGEIYREKGFMAYAVVIHLTYLNKKSDMHIMHFVSDRTGSTADPAGKYGEALNKLKSEKNDNGLIFNSNACAEFITVPTYRGLGYVKKLSMQHHLELVADFLSHN